MKRVLFVCTGNICRSPMAHGLFEELVRGRDDIEVNSAGIGAVTGQRPSSYAADAMSELEIDIDHVRSKPLTADLVRRSDFIFVMTYGHLDSMLMLYPYAAEKTFLLREFETELPPMEREVSDPIGQSLETYTMCRDQIREALPRVLEIVLRSMQNDPGSSGGAATPPTRARIALAADVSSHEVKEAVRAALGNMQVDVEDFSDDLFATSHTREPWVEVAEAVSMRRVEFGILISRNGLRMSMMANKVRGVRAALCHNAETARLSRHELDANVLCLAADELKPKRVKEILEVWLTTAFAGPGHDLEYEASMESTSSSPSQSDVAPANLAPLEIADPAVFAAIRAEESRQRDNIELIASENFTSRAVMQAQGSCLTNKYAEGYPGRRWYGGCEHVDVVEQLAIERAKQLFGTVHANVQPHSGSQANTAVYFSVLEPGDTILTMDLSHGGHLTHGHKMNFSGRFYKVVHYGVSPETETIDYENIAQLAREHRPKMITAGASAYSRFIDFPKMREIADEVGAMLFIDMAHIAGLVAAGVHPSPVPYADFVTTTTHKTLRGPRGGLILCGEKYAKQIDSQVFPGIQGGPLMHVIAAKAVCLGEALEPGFKNYQQQVTRNAKALCEGLKKNGYRIVSGSTDNHLMLVDLQPKGLTGKDVQELLDRVSITVNKNAIPFDKQSPFKAGGIRVGTPAVTTRGMKEDEMFDIANLIHDAIENREDEKVLARVQEKVREITMRFGLPY